MNANYRQYVWILAGGYAAFIGFRMIRDEVTNTVRRPVFIAVGILFIAAGLGIALYAYRKIRSNSGEEASDADSSQSLESSSSEQPSSSEEDDIQ